jgi:hypothetical protein
MLKSKLLEAIRTELRRHDLSHFQEDKIVVPAGRCAAKGSTRSLSSSTTSPMTCCRVCWIACRQSINVPVRTSSFLCSTAVYSAREAGAVKTSIRS